MRALILGAGLLALLTACSSGAGVVELTDTPADEMAADTSAVPDTPRRVEEVAPDDVVTFDFLPPQDLETQDTPPLCAGEGCFLEPCTQNADCQSGWCVEHLGAGVCTRYCQEDCPPGWLCKQVGGTDPDLVFVCVSQHANLCKPCHNAADCKTVGGIDDVCVDYGEEGAFCGGKCASHDDCPWGFSCLESETVEGVAVSQCVADTGVCPCTGKSVDLALSTDCEVVNEFGTCTGSRVCSADGLTDCDAAVPAQETCDGVDNDCDGETDEPALVGGDYINLCDDSNDCTQDTCEGSEGCVNAVLDSGSCDDDDPCTIADHCVDGTCLGDPVDCDDENPCTDDSCTQQGGCIHAPNTLACDDEDPCTLADQCGDGTCAGTPVDCQCQTDADCAALEDGDLCNGTLVCDTSGLPYQCMVDPETVVTCPEPTGDEAFCLQSTCDPATGACSVVPANEGLLCEAGDLCLVNNRCTQGACVAGMPVNCNDGNVCTDDACAPEAGCVYTDNTAPCSDGNVCTTQDQCAAGQCTGGAPLACDDSNPCTDDACDPAVGCVHTPNADPCDDSNACTTNDQCKLGQCVGGPAPACDDGNVCTTDSCDPAAGCVHALNTAPCDDGNLCTHGDSCQLGECVGKGTLPCDDANPCTDDSCSPQAGCQFKPNTNACDDGNECTVDDQCANGWCQPGPALECDDGNHCTTDSCQPGQGCTFVNNTAPCDDADPCTTGDACFDGSCQGGPALSCDDNNPCTDDSCDPQSGCVYVNNEAGCEDGNACTTGDTCVQGACVPGTGTLPCADENPCTDDACNPDVGCIFVNNAAPCDDGDACTAGDACAAGACVAGPPLECPDDGNTCTTHACDSQSGCVTTTLPDCCGNDVKEAGEECDDGNQTDGDGCSAQCADEAGSCFADWMVGLPSSDSDCTTQETGYHWKGIYNGYACWWNTKNQAWNSPATNPYQLAQFFGLDVGTGQVSWCHSYSSTPSPPLGGCHGYCDINETHMWGWCGGAPFTSGGWLCFLANGKQACE